MTRSTPVVGVLLVDKPRGMTSFDVVAAIRRLARVRRVGHAGTLDPMATGVLTICVGEATKLVPFLTEQSKCYQATVRLGESTDTYDADGRIVARAEPSQVAAIDMAAVAGALRKFVGSILQRPPVYSAIRVGGKRSHRLARAGESVELPLRRVVVYSAEPETLVGADFTFVVRCSKGTYVRSLAADLGDALGVGGHLVALRRLAVGRFGVDECTPLDRLLDDPSRLYDGLIPLAEAVADLPLIRLADGVLDDVRHGRRCRLIDVSVGLSRGIDPDGRLVAILECDDQGNARVVRGFCERDLSAGGR